MLSNTASQPLQTHCMVDTSAFNCPTPNLFQTDTCMWLYIFSFEPDAYWIFLLLVTGIHVYLLFLIYLCSFKKSINMYVCWVCMNVCGPPQECLVSTEARRWCWSTWDQSYRQLTAMWVLGIEPGTSGRAVSAFTSRTSPGTQWMFLICTLKM